MRDTAADLDRFYSLLSRLESFASQGLRLDTYSGETAFPVRGVYFSENLVSTDRRGPSVANRACRHSCGECGIKIDLVGTAQDTPWDSDRRRQSSWVYLSPSRWRCPACPRSGVPSHLGCRFHQPRPPFAKFDSSWAEAVWGAESIRIHRLP